MSCAMRAIAIALFVHTAEAAVQAIAVDTSAALQGEGRTLQTEHRVPELDGSVSLLEERNQGAPVKPSELSTGDDGHFKPTWESYCDNAVGTQGGWDPEAPVLVLVPAFDPDGAFAASDELCSKLLLKLQRKYEAVNIAKVGSNVAAMEAVHGHKDGTLEVVVVLGQADPAGLVLGAAGTRHHMLSFSGGRAKDLSVWLSKGTKRFLRALRGKLADYGWVLLNSHRPAGRRTRVPNFQMVTFAGAASRYLNAVRPWSGRLFGASVAHSLGQELVLDSASLQPLAIAPVTSREEEDSLFHHGKEPIPIQSFGGERLSTGSAPADRRAAHQLLRSFDDDDDDDGDSDEED